MTESRWLAEFAAALGRGDIEAASRLFEPEGFWRDLVAFTWTLKTFEGRDQIKAMLAACLEATKPSAWQPRCVASKGEFWFSFETAAGRGIGHLRLREGKAWTLLTALLELRGFEEKSGHSRERGTEHGVLPERKSWLDRKLERERRFLTGERQPYVLIVGGGQGGIALAARLQRLEVPTLVIEKNARAGDSWRKRYKSLCLHDPVWYDHMPYLPFPDHWPVFSPKDRIADWLEMYVRVMDLDYWTSAECVGASFAEDGWMVKVRKEGQALLLKPTHLVLATGMSGVPNMPELPGRSSFWGAVEHSSVHPGGEGWRGKRCVVLGSNNSAHDIAADLWEHGAEAVTMIQRSPTVVVRSEMLMEHAWGKLYSQEALESGITTEIADLTLAATPFRLLAEMQKPVYEKIRELDAELYAGLDRAGFRYHFGEDGSGLHSIYLRRGAGYYIDVGASRLVIDGRIKLVHGTVEGLADGKLVLSDKTRIPVDLVVCATGYGSMNGWAAKLISQEVADRVGKCWGLGSDTKGDPGPWVGELRNMWKPTQQPNLWFHGGNLMQSRHYSLYLALQLKARYEEIPTPVSFLDPVHHLA
ncbi:MAG TPA: NAD(P)/FAD-dependent oxidoreductase [Burkholderiales bacterium]|nr:NAD(P)/FAD-dependent oxidoreductase [Burkholderiales bacterium]